MTHESGAAIATSRRDVASNRGMAVRARRRRGILPARWDRVGAAGTSRQYVDAGVHDHTDGTDTGLNDWS
jgi:hypothetical protein